MSENRLNTIFNSIISNDYLKRLLLTVKEKRAKPFESFNIVKKLQEFAVDDSLKARLIQVFDNEKNNCVFIDFWESWCAPCMQELPYYSKLMEEFKDTDINFLFFAVETPEEKVLELKNKYDIQGKFIVLSDNETKIMNNVLRFNTYPSHFIARNSAIVDNSIGGITSGNGLNPEVVKKIREYTTAVK